MTGICICKVSEDSMSYGPYITPTVTSQKWGYGKNWYDIRGQHLKRIPYVTRQWNKFFEILGAPDVE